MNGAVSFAVINIGTLSMNRFWGETTRVREPSATCTLLESGGQRVLVDPSPHPEALAAKLFARTGLRPAAIDAVFLTHAHGDHRFGLSLFDHAVWLMAEAELEDWRMRSLKDHGVADRFVRAEGAMPEGVTLLEAPGHTHHLHALRAETPWGVLVVAGDAVMTRDYLAAEEGFHNSVDFEAAAETIRMIKETADLIIPGHDNLLPT